MTNRPHVTTSCPPRAYRHARVPGRAFLLLALIACLASCHARVAPVESPAAPISGRIAVLPFVSRSMDRRAITVARRAFQNQLSSLGWEPVPLEQVDDALKRVEQRPQADLTAPPGGLDRLGLLLNADAVVVAEVTEFGRTGAGGNEAMVGLKARLLDCATGKVLWEEAGEERVSDLSAGLSGPAAKVVAELPDRMQAALGRAATELCRRLAASIPHGGAAAADSVPRIDNFFHNGAGRILYPGERLRVVLLGEPGKTATWDIHPSVHGLVMSEKSPGVYVGSYVVSAGDRISRGRIDAHLAGTRGRASSWQDCLGPLSIGLPRLLPDEIAKDTTLSADKSPYIVESFLTVLPGATLRIEPGVTIWFKRLGLVVKGAIQAMGTEENPVMFLGAEPFPWRGIVLSHAQGENTFICCTISRAQCGLRSLGSKFLMRRSILRDNELGIVAEDGEATIERSIVRGSAKTGIVARRIRLGMTGTTIVGNGTGGVLLQASDAPLSGNTIVRNRGFDVRDEDAHADGPGNRNERGREDSPPLPAPGFDDI